MEVRKPGSGQRGWSKELSCTGKGHGDGGCGAELRVEQPDLFRVPGSGLETMVAYQCAECGVLTNLGLAYNCGLPQYIWANLPNRDPAKLPLPDRKTGRVAPPRPDTLAQPATPAPYVSPRTEQTHKCAFCPLNIESARDGVVLEGNLYGGRGVGGILGKTMREGDLVRDLPVTAFHLPCFINFFLTEHPEFRTTFALTDPLPRPRLRLAQVLTGVGLRVAGCAVGSPYDRDRLHAVLREVEQTHWTFAEGSEGEIRELNRAVESGCRQLLEMYDLQEKTGNVWPRNTDPYYNTLGKIVRLYSAQKPPGPQGLDWLGDTATEYDLRASAP